MQEHVQQLKIAEPRHLLFCITSGIEQAILKYSKAHAYLNIFPQEIKQYKQYKNTYLQSAIVSFFC
jgi:hypothetical protein